jgi:hypothetical protein
MLPRAFPLLRRFPAPRCLGGVVISVLWVSILDEAWDPIAANPPDTLWVRVADLPRDAEAREYSLPGQHRTRQHRSEDQCLLDLGRLLRHRLCLCLPGEGCGHGRADRYQLIPETKRLSLDQVYVLYRNSTPRGSAAYRQILSPQISDVAVETAHDDGEVESEQMEAEQMEAGTSANSVRQLWLEC